MAQVNPFNYNLPVLPTDFVGRWDLVQKISEDLSNLVKADSWAVIGGRRFGKSSVLRSLASFLNEQNGRSGFRYVFPIVINLGRSTKRTERDVFFCILRDIYKALSVHPNLERALSSSHLINLISDSTDECSFFKFEDALNDLTKEFENEFGLIRLALLLDEVESTVNSDWSEILFDQLRSLVYDSTLADRIKLVLTGSASVVKVRQEGSPLLNAVKITHLKSLPSSAIEELISRAGDIPVAVSEAIQTQCGGHPFIAQYLLHHLWDQDPTGATSMQVLRLAREMRQVRAEDFLGWWKAIGDSGRQAYALIAGAEGWVDEHTLISQVRNTVQPLDQGLSALCYHGLTIRSENGEQYLTAGVLLRNWWLKRSASKQSCGRRPALLTEDQKPITWLHLSDIHFHDSSTYNENVVLRKLLWDVKEVIDRKSLHPDIILFTGDLAYSGKASQYKAAGNFFDELLSITDLPRSRLFMVPGNHDVDWEGISDIAKYTAEMLTDRERTNRILAADKAKEREFILARFRSYADFLNGYLEGHLFFDHDQFFYVKTIELGGRCIALLGLNSAWIAEGKIDETRKLLLGDRQVRAVLDAADEAGADLKIALMHHPFDWLRPFDRHDCESMLLDNCHFVLHGHLHHTAINHLKNPDSSAMVIAGGACYETREHPNSYNFVRLDFTLHKGMIYLRRYNDERGGFWAPDTSLYKNAPSGEYEFPI